MNHITNQNPESTMMGQPTTIVAVYPTHTAAEAAVHELKQSGFDLRKLSIIGRDYHTEEHVLGYYNAGDRMKAWGKAGAFWGALWGCCLGRRISGFPVSDRCWWRCFSPPFRDAPPRPASATRMRQSNSN